MKRNPKSIIKKPEPLRAFRSVSFWETWIGVLLQEMALDLSRWSQLSTRYPMDPGSGIQVLANSQMFLGLKGWPGQLISSGLGSRGWFFHEMLRASFVCFVFGLVRCSCLLFVVFLLKIWDIWTDYTDPTAGRKPLKTSFSGDVFSLFCEKGKARCI